MNRVWIACVAVLAVVSGALAYEVFEPVQDSYAGYIYDGETGEIYFADENFGESEYILIYSHYGWDEYFFSGYIQYSQKRPPEILIFRALFRLHPGK